MNNQQLTTGKIVVGAMAMGIIAFAVVVVVLVRGGAVAPQMDDAKLLLAALAAVAVPAIPIYLVLRQAFVKKLREKHGNAADKDLPIEELAKQYFALTIIGGALVEGPSLFAIVIVLLTGNLASLVVPALGLIAFALLLPTQERFDSFVESVIGRLYR